MNILVDADACPVKEIIEKVGKECKLPVTMLIDTSHILSSTYSKIVTIEQGPDSVDLALINLTHAGDIVVTQDYGVAALALGKKAFCIHPAGKIYTDNNIDLMLFERHLSKKQRKSGAKTGHARKRTQEDDLHFERNFRSLCKKCNS